MKRINDERLLLQNLKNVRIAFIVQTLGIIAFLFYEGVTNGVRAVVAHPLWLVFIITMVVFQWLNLEVSLDVYDSVSKEKKPLPYYLTVIASAIIGIAVALFARFGPDSSGNRDAALVGGVVFLCILVPFSYAYYRQKIRKEEHDI